MVPPNQDQHKQPPRLSWSDYIVSMIYDGYHIKVYHRPKILIYSNVGPQHAG